MEDSTIMMVLLIVLVLLLIYKHGPNPRRPELRECLDAILKEALTLAHVLTSGYETRNYIGPLPTALLVNKFASIFYWRHESKGEVMESIEISIVGLIGPGHGVLGIYWLNGEIEDHWYHNTTSLPAMNVGERYNASRIIQEIRQAYNLHKLAS